MQENENIAEWEKKQRMQAKAVLCVVGIVLLFLLGIRFGEQDKEVVPAKPEPVIIQLKNVYVENVTDTYITVFDDERKNLALPTHRTGAKNRSVSGGDVSGSEASIPDSNDVGRIVDITLTDNVVTAIVRKDAGKINGKVVTVEEGVGVELENHGFFPFAEDKKIYTLYGQLSAGTTGDIRIGYEFADFVIEDGKICAVLLTRDESMEYIRVLIKTDDYAGNYHESLTLTSDADYVLQYGSEEALTEEVYGAGQELTLTTESPCFQLGNNRILIKPEALTAKVNISSVNRSQGIPSYRGTIEVRCTDKGLVVINEVLLEEYLYAVIPSEMPATYPLEALKAQAICARTYAYSHMLNPGYPEVGAHVDDSTGYQVYNNISEQSETTKAVKETAGQLLYADGAPVSTYYYSTSCGFGSDEHVWCSQTAPELPYLSATSISRECAEGKTSIYTAETMKEEAMFAQFLDYPPESDFEKTESWYRWWYEVTDVDSERILENLKGRYAANNQFVLTLKEDAYVSADVEKLGDVQSISVVKRGAGGVAEEIVIEGEKATYKVISELFIRYVLCDGVTRVKKQDGSMVDMKSLLPSAYFVITPIEKNGIMTGYKIYGGGFGHGAGMSQNGAKNMANEGFSAEQILTFFYKNSMVTMINNQ